MGEDNMYLTEKQLAELLAFYKTELLRPRNRDRRIALKFLKQNKKDIEYVILGRIKPFCNICGKNMRKYQSLRLHQRLFCLENKPKQGR